MKTVSILQYDHEDRQFYPSFVIHNDWEDVDNECAYDELILQPSEEWMEDYLQWNRFGRLPDDPAEDLSEEDDPSSIIPTFDSLEELHRFNAQGHELTQQLQAELNEGRSSNKSSSNPQDQAATSTCTINVSPFKPLYSNMVVGPISAWWHVKDRNYGFVVPVQRLPVSDQLKSRLQAFRCHKGMEFWKLNDSDTLQQLQQEGRDLQDDLLRELQYKAEGGGSSNTKEEDDNAATADATVARTDSLPNIGAMVEQSCTLVATAPTMVDRASWLPQLQPRVH